MAKKKAPIKKNLPINWLRDWTPFNFSGLTPAQIATRQARVEQIVVEFLSRQNASSNPKYWHFITHDNWQITGSNYRYIVFLTPPVKEAQGGPGTLDPPPPTQPPPPPLS